MVTRARTVFAAAGPIPSDTVIRRALNAALSTGTTPSGGRQRRQRIKAAAEAAALQREPSAREIRLAAKDAERNKRLVESGSTFAGHKPSDFRR
jgi:hypothetical protein